MHLNDRDLSLSSSGAFIATGAGEGEGQGRPPHIKTRGRHGSLRNGKM